MAYTKLDEILAASKGEEITHIILDKKYSWTITPFEKLIFGKMYEFNDPAIQVYLKSCDKDLSSIVVRAYTKNFALITVCNHDSEEGFDAWIESVPRNPENSKAYIYGY